MEIYQIKNLDCSIKTNRIALVKETMKTLKIDKRPMFEELERYVKIMSKKYKIPIKLIVCNNNNEMMVSIESFNGSYSILTCKSMYELCCKYILFVKEIVKYRKKEVK